MTSPASVRRTSVVGKGLPTGPSLRSPSRWTQDTPRASVWPYTCFRLIPIARKNRKISARVQHPQVRGDRSLLHPEPGHHLSDRHEPSVEPALQEGGVVHLHLDRRDQVLPDSRGRDHEVGADFPQVLENRFGTLGAVDRAADHEGARQRPERIADPGWGQIRQHLVGPIVTLDLEDALDRAHEIAVRDHGPLRGSGGAGGVAEERHVLGTRRLNQLLEKPLPLRVQLPSHLLEVVEAEQAGIVVMAEPLGVVVDHLLDLREAPFEVEDLVDLLLVLGIDELGIRMVDDVLDLPRDGVLVHRHGHAADGLRGHHDRIDLGPVVAEQRQLVPPLEPEMHQSEGEGPHVGEVLRPGPLLPDTLFLLPERGIPGMLPGIAKEELGKRHLCHTRASYAVALVPRYALMTCGFAFTTAGMPSAIFSPRSSTTTRREMSMTTLMSCSIRMMVVPHSSLTSRMKRAISSFSSMFIPPMGSSRSSTFG